MKCLKWIFGVILSAALLAVTTSSFAAAEDGQKIDGRRLYQGPRSEYYLLRDMIESLEESLVAADKLVNKGEFREYLLKSESGGLDPIPVIYDQKTVVAVVADIFTSSAAARAGIRPSDIIRAIGDVVVCGALDPVDVSDRSQMQALALQCRDEVVRALVAVGDKNEFTVGILRDQQPLSYRIDKNDIGKEVDVAIAKHQGKWNSVLNNIKHGLEPAQEQFKKLSPESAEKKIFALQNKVDALGNKLDREVFGGIEKVRDSLMVEEKE